MIMLMFPIKTTLSTFFKISNGRTLLNRWFSSKNHILHETIRVHPTAQEDVFIQPTEDLSILPTRTILFGGTMIGTAINAAQQTVSQNQSVHSIHSYYVFAADASSPIFYHVTRVRDGKSFTTRSVVAKQNERIVFQCSMSFHQHEKGNLMHQTPFQHTDVPRPEDLLSVDQYLQEILQDRRLTPETKRIAEQELVIPIGLDIRYCQRRDLIEPKAQWPARLLAWVKTIDPLPNDPQIHQSIIAYASDRILLVAAYYPYELIGFDSRVKLQTSLDHAIWFHDGFDWNRSEKDEEKSKKTMIPRSSSIPIRPKHSPVRADQWLLFDIDCPMQMNNRAFAMGRVWTQDRRLVATCTQEGVMRMK